MDINNPKIKRADGEGETRASIEEKCTLPNAPTTTTATPHAKIPTTITINAHVKL